MTITTAHREGVATPRFTSVKEWVHHGACSKGEPDALFVRGGAQKAAKQVCKGCPVISECLADSLDNRTQFGVWGGMTERQRRVLLKRRPKVLSWRALFEADRMRLQLHHPQAGSPTGAQRTRWADVTPVRNDRAPLG